MKFKSFVKNYDLFEREITDFWPVNKAMFNMQSPEGKKEYEDALKDYFDMFQNRNQRKLVSEQKISEPYKITCWRGCDEMTLKRDTIEVQNDYIVLHGTRAMEGILWFTHSLQSMEIDPEQYAVSHAEDYLITYFLNATRHYVLKKYDNGESERDIPQEISKQNVSSESSRFLLTNGSAYEVPEGWLFTWQIQKHLGCSKPLKVMKNMIKSMKN